MQYLFDYFFEFFCPIFGGFSRYRSLFIERAAVHKQNDYAATAPP